MTSRTVCRLAATRTPARRQDPGPPRPRQWVDDERCARSGRRVISEPRATGTWALAA